MNDGDSSVVMDKIMAPIAHRGGYLSGRIRLFIPSVMLYLDQRCR